MADERLPFLGDYRRMPGGVIRIHARGYLRARDCDYLKKVDPLFKAGEQHGLLFIEDLHGFDAGEVARQHGRWFADKGDSIRRIAVVSKRVTVTFAVAAVRLLTRHEVRVFPDETAATAWLKS